MTKALAQQGSCNLVEPQDAPVALIMLQRTIGLSWDPRGAMQTMRAIALIEQAVQLADQQFPGDPLAEACRFASREERQAVLCIVRSRPALFDRSPTPQNVMAALREMVRSKPAQTVLQRCPVVWAT